jgi:hypothetical protein
MTELSKLLKNIQKNDLIKFSLQNKKGYITGKYIKHDGNNLYIYFNNEEEHTYKLDELDEFNDNKLSNGGKRKSIKSRKSKRKGKRVKKTRRHRRHK